MRGIFDKILQWYTSKTSSLPENVIWFRDGVADSALSQLNEEIFGAKESLQHFRQHLQKTKKTVICESKILLILLQKRHMIKAFQETNYKDNTTKFSKVQAGTLISSGDVTKGPNNFYIFGRYTKVGLGR